MPASIIGADGKPRQLDAKAEPDEQVTEEDVQQPAKLARLLTRLLAVIAKLLRAWNPRRIDFENIAIAPDTTYRFTHKFGGRARWWLVSWKPTSFASNWYPFLLENPSNPSTNDVLILTASSVTDGVASIRVEEAG